MLVGASLTQVVLYGTLAYCQQLAPFLKTTSSTDNIIQISEEQFEEFVTQTGTSLVYLYTTARRPSLAFEKVLNRAATALKPYDIKVAKVNCEEPNFKICNDEIIHKNVFVFRDGKKIVLPKDTIKKQHIVVAILLHIAVVDKVPILRTKRDLQKLQKKCRQEKDLVLLYLPDFGSYQHRIFMETVHAYIDRYEWAITTSFDVTEGLRKPIVSVDDTVEPADTTILWALHCKTENCQSSLHHMPINIINLERFLNALHFPNWVEAQVDDKKILKTDYSNMQMPVALLIYESEKNKDDVLQIAQQLGELLRGSVGITTVSLNKIPQSAWNSWKLNNKLVQPPVIAFLPGDYTDRPAALINGLNNGYEFVCNQLEKLGDPYLPEIIYEELEDSEELALLQQDDPAILSLKELRKKKLKKTPERTEKQLRNLLEESNDEVVLFYLPWDPIGEKILYILQSLEARATWEAIRINCYDWTDICRQQNITSFPALRFYQRDGGRSKYDGLTEENDIFSTVTLWKTHNPILLTSETVHDLINGTGQFKFTENMTAVIVGGFFQFQNEMGNFLEAADAYRGKYLFGLCQNNVALEIGNKYSLRPPYLIVFRRGDTLKPYLALTTKMTKNSITEFVAREIVHTFPELTVHNYVLATQKGVQLAVLLKSNLINHQAHAIIEQLSLQDSLPVSISWLDSDGETGRHVRNHYNISTIPAFLIFGNQNSDVHMYICQQWLQQDVSEWIKRVFNGSIEPSFRKTAKEWRPAMPAFNYAQKIEDDKNAEAKELSFLLADDEMEEFETQLFNRADQLPGPTNHHLHHRTEL